MKKILKYFLSVLWLLSFSVAFLWMWTKVPALWLINLPEPAYIWLMRTFNVLGAESAMDLEMDIAFGLGFVLASIILALFLFVKNRKKQADKQLSGQFLNKRPL